MMDTIAQILHAMEYLLLLATLIVFWGKTFRQPELRNYWGLLALAWTMNLLGNIIWVVNDLFSKNALDSLTAVDFFYGLRYILLIAVLWLHPVRLTRREGAWASALGFVVAVIVSIVYFESAPVLRNEDWTDFLGLAIYPVLDVAMVTLAWLRTRTTRDPWWIRNTLFLFCSMACYGIANTINLAHYIFSAISVGISPSVFWTLANAFLLIMALGDHGMKKDKE
jgi:hypothetical protein